MVARRDRRRLFRRGSATWRKTNELSGAGVVFKTWNEWQMREKDTMEDGEINILLWLM